MSKPKPKGYLTPIEIWALQLVRRSERRFGRAPTPVEVCKHHRLKYPDEGMLFKSAVRRLMKKGHLVKWAPTYHLRTTV